MNGLPGLRLLPDAPVPDGRTVLTDPDAFGVEAVTGSRAASAAIHTGYESARALQQEIGRRTDVVGIFPDDQSLIRLAGMLCIEQNDEWLVGRRYLSAESISLVMAGRDDHTDKEIKEEVAQLEAV
jgi:Transposase, Mutator family